MFMYLFVKIGIWDLIGILSFVLTVSLVECRCSYANRRVLCLRQQC